MAETAQALGKEFKLEVEVLERADMEKLGMGSALSVGRASHEPCKFIVMHYRGGAAKAKPIVLIGKGLTFDTGGISLKPGDDLDMMKYDMAGGGSVLGVMKTIARLALPLNVVGIVGAVENMPGGNASRPGDVVTSMSGQTIEILNTDAEGRLVLCDALTYAERFEPACVDRRRHPDRRLRHRARHADQRALRQRRRARRRAARERRRRGRSRLAAAAVGRVPDAAEEQLRRHEQPRRAPGRRGHGGVLPRALRGRLQVGAPRHRGHRVGVGRREGLRPAGRCRCWRSSCSGAPTARRPEQPAGSASHDLDRDLHPIERVRRSLP